MLNQFQYTHPSVLEFILFDRQATGTDHLPLDFVHGRRLGHST